MASQPTAGAESPLPLATPRAMTRCECSGVPFSRVAAEVLGEGRTPAEACRVTGCGQTCGACLPDLHAYLAGLAR